jgi:spore coat protein U-like protein
VSGFGYRLQAGSSSGRNLEEMEQAEHKISSSETWQLNNQDISVPICGRIPAGQGAGVGNYTNTLTVTINF